MCLSYEVEIDVLLQWFHLLFDRDASEQVRPCTHLFNDEQNAVRRKEYFVLVTTTRTSELNTVDSWNKEIYVVGSVNTIRLRRYGCETLTEGSLRRKIGEKEKEKEE